MSDKVEKFMKSLKRNNNGHLRLDSDKYTPMILFRGVDCMGCKQKAVMTDKVVCRDFPELFRRAEKQHLQIPEQTKVACDSPLLMIDYSMVFIQNELIEALESPNIIL